MCQLLLFPIILSLLNSLAFQKKLCIFCACGWRNLKTIIKDNNFEPLNDDFN